MDISKRLEVLLEKSVQTKGQKLFLITKTQPNSIFVSPPSTTIFGHFRDPLMEWSDEHTGDTPNNNKLVPAQTSHRTKISWPHCGRGHMLASYARLVSESSQSVLSETGV
jgi:hypothetical protein